MKKDGRKKGTPLWQQYGFTSEAAFRARYPEVEGNNKKNRKRRVRQSIVRNVRGSTDVG